MTYSILMPNLKKKKKVNGASQLSVPFYKYIYTFVFWGFPSNPCTELKSLKEHADTA